MPLFGHKSDPVPAQPAPAPRTSHDTGRKGIFGSRRRSSSLSDSDIGSRHNNNTNHITKRSSGTGGLFSRNHEDPSIAAARTRVHAAEQAERDADRALIQAREAVREARDHVRRLELEAKEDARLAKIKQDQAHSIGKSAKGLGRHG